jgi:hypothetical protein
MTATKKKSVEKRMHNDWLDQRLVMLGGKGFFHGRFTQRHVCHKAVKKNTLLHQGLTQNLA